MADRTYSIDEVKAIADYVETRRSSKVFTPPHGQNALFNAPGVRPEMWDLTPNILRLAAIIPLVPSLNEQERFEYVTGITAQTGSNPTNTCDTAPKSGKMKVGDVFIPYGTFFKGTEEFNVAEAGQYYNRADVDRSILNPAVPDANQFVPLWDTGADYNTWLGKAYREFGQGAQLDFAYVDWQGDKTKANTVTQLGFIREYDGLNIAISTTHVDMFSGANITALSSIVRNYNATLSGTIVVQLANIIRSLKLIAKQRRDSGVNWAVVVHPTLTFALYDVWACNYQTARCTVTDNAAMRIDGSVITALRDEMINGNYLLVDGQRIPVLEDDGINATLSQTTGLWTSNIYVIALADMGRPLIYHEYLPYDAQNKSVSEFIAMTNASNIRVLNGGLYLMGSVYREGFCVTYKFTSKVRLIVERPDLCGRLDNVTYSAGIEWLDPNPSGSYHRDGGRTQYNAVY